GIVVASTGGELGLSLAAQEEVAAALDGRLVSSLRRRAPLNPLPSLDSISRAGDLRVFVTLPALESGRVLGAVMLSRTPRSIAQALYGKRWHLLGLALVLLAGGVAVAWFTARMGSRPIGASLRQGR